MAKYFSVEVKPDIVNGTIAGVIAVNAADNPYAAKDVVFDWTSFDIPKGTVNLVSICAYFMGEDGGESADKDFHLMFAKSINGVAPASLGDSNDIPDTHFDMPRHLVGAAKLEGTVEGFATIFGASFGQIFTSNLLSSGNSGGGGLSQIMTAEPDSGANVGYDRLYVAGIAGGALDFSTGVLSTGVISADDNPTIEVDQVDARKCFQVGDTVHVHDVDAVLGVVDSVTEGVITLTTNNIVAVANNDEIINANPIKLVLGFTK